MCSTQPELIGKVAWFASRARSAGRVQIRLLSPQEGRSSHHPQGCLTAQGGSMRRYHIIPEVLSKHHSEEALLEVFADDAAFQRAV